LTGYIFEVLPHARDASVDVLFTGDKPEVYYDCTRFGMARESCASDWNIEENSNEVPGFHCLVEFRHPHSSCFACGGAVQCRTLLRSHSS
jgi:hypothetical protein